MQLLNSVDYIFSGGLAADAPHDLAVAAVLAGRAAGRVYADDPDAPRLALVSPHWGRLYVLGRANAQAASALAALVQEQITPAARAAGASVFTLACPPDWEPYLSEALQSTRAVPADRQYYRWAGEAYPRFEPPDGFTLLRVDEGLLARPEIRDLQLLAEEMASERTSVDDFLARSFGVAALWQDRLAGWCLSEYNTETRCEVGIATLEPFQRRGLASALGCAFLDMARAQAMSEVGWHCWKRNVPSAASALKIGLAHVADYPVRFGWYNESDAPR